MKGYPLKKCTKSQKREKEALVKFAGENSGGSPKINIVKIVW